MRVGGDSEQCLLFFFNDTAPTEIYTLSLHDALPISIRSTFPAPAALATATTSWPGSRSEEHTSELQSLRHLVCRLLLEKNKHYNTTHLIISLGSSALLLTGPGLAD